jgi:hypothetical protein
MTRNRSKGRKEERKEKARVRDTQKLVRDCGHWHTDNGAKFCAEWTPIRLPSTD